MRSAAYLVSILLLTATTIVGAAEPRSANDHLTDATGKRAAQPVARIAGMTFETDPMERSIAEHRLTDGRYLRSSLALFAPDDPIPHPNPMDTDQSSSILFGLQMSF